MNRHEIMEKDDVAKTKPISIKLIYRIFQSAGAYAFVLLGCNIFLFICIYADLEAMAEIGRILDRDDLSTQSIWNLIGYLAFLFLINRIFGFSQFIFSIMSSIKAIEKLRKQFFDHLMELSKSFYDKHKIGWLVARATGDMGAIFDFMTFSLMMIMISTGVVTITMLKISDIQLSLLLPSLSIIPITFTASVLFKKKMSNNQRELRDANSKMIAYLSESIRGIRVTQAFHREKVNKEKFEDHNQKNYDHGLDASKINGLYLPSIDLIGMFTLILSMAYGSYLFINHMDDLLLTKGQLATYLLLVSQLLFPIRLLVELHSLSISAMASAERIYEVIDLEPTVVESKQTQKIIDCQGHFECRDVSFQYDSNGPMILKNVSFEILPQQTIALAGETGAGKSTLAALLARFYDTTKGTIYLDGKPIHLYAQDDLHQEMGIVLQEGFLFSGSVMDNLKFRCPTIENSSVISFAKELGTHQTFMSLPAGYDTKVGEGGHAVSHGQRQLISLTRAMLSKPKILIFDEATSSIDVFTESLITQAIKKISKQTTTIIIAHRLSTIKHAHQILVIGKGGILQKGTYNSLASEEGYFAQLVQNLKNPE